MKKWIIINLFALLISACVSRESVFSTIKGNSGLIAFLGKDGNVYISDQGGDDIKQLTTDAKSQNNDFVTYELPTWSQGDNTQLAFIRTSGSSAATSSKIIVTDTTGSDIKEIYASDTEHPFYMYWAPNGEQVSFLSTTAINGLLMVQSAPAQGGDRTIIDTGSPYYWSWAPDGKTMITHSGGASTSTTPEHLAFLQMQGSNVTQSDLDTTPASFQAPAWSPDGNHIALTRAEDGKNEIILTDGHGEFEKRIGTFGEYTALGWSSTSTKLAYIDGSVTALNAGVIGKLNVLDIASMKTVSTEADNVFAFFWSPDGEQIVYFVPVFGGNSGASNTNSQQLFLQTFLLDVESGSSRELFTFLPTQQFTSLLPYFDQYHQSVTIWSPDSHNLVLPFIDQQEDSGIAVVDITGEEPATSLLAKGVLAFWSWK